MNIIANRIKELRKSKNLTQIELAKQIGMSRAALSLYEIGKREPDSKTINKLADFFNVSTDYLLGRTDDPSPKIKGPTDQEILEIMKKEGIMFDGTPLDEEDKRDIIEVMKIAWKIVQERKRNKEQE
ncbi:MAG: Helix-turn-helix domain protein [Clostridiales bacterium]|jgi:transcriptional regulator with XRE-family HTH domain|nr:Helix-turn-helix domain protein [Clostridiales bacterium]